MSCHRRPKARGTSPSKHLPLLCLLPALMAHAHAGPDAGSLLQQTEISRLPVLPASTPAPLQVRQGQVLPLNPQQRVDITRFEIEGHQLLSTAQLQAVLAPFLGPQRSLSDLQAAAAAVVEAYAQAGWLARCTLPPQDITEGAVRLGVVEAVFDTVQLEGQWQRFDAQLAVERVLAQQAQGGKLKLSALDRAVALINELPGVAAQGVLTAGSHEGETALVLKLSDTPMYNRDVRVDNHGGQASGDVRVTGQLTVNGAFGLGDALSLQAMRSAGSTYVRVAGSLPMGPQGWRGGLNASAMHYRLLGPDFAALQAHGHSQTLGLDTSYAALRSRTAQVSLQSSAERKQFHNAANGTVVSRYHSTQASAGMSALLLDDGGSAGVSTAGVMLSRGHLDLSGSPSFSGDAQGMRSHGPYMRLRFQLSRQQALNDQVSAYLGLSGQWANRNLDSSEKFYLGGPQGVRAYPANEAGGSWGQLVNWELRAPLANGLRGTLFYDWGRVHLHAHGGFPGAPTANVQTLQGLGLGVAWTGPKGLDLQATVARRVGHPTAPNGAAKDPGKAPLIDRIWLQSTLPF